LSALSASLLVSLITHPLVGIGLFVGFGLPGILMGYMLKRNTNPYITVFVCGLVLALTSVAELLISFKAVGIDLVTLFAEMEESIQQNMDIIIDMYTRFGVGEENVKVIKDYAGTFIEMTKILLPSSMLFAGIISSLLDFKLTRVILKRIGYEVSDIRKFMLWRIPEPYSIILLVIAIIAGAGSYIKVEWLQAVLLNISSLIIFIFTVLGVSVIVYFFKVYGNKYDVPKPVRVLVAIIAAMMFMQFIPLIGIIDTILNFRRIE